MKPVLTHSQPSVITCLKEEKKPVINSYNDVAEMLRYTPSFYNSDNNLLLDSNGCDQGPILDQFVVIKSFNKCINTNK